MLILLGAVAVAVIAGGVAAVAGFGVGSLLTPVVALELGTSVAVAVVAVPHAVATALRLWNLRSAIDGGVLRTFGVASAAGGLAGAALHATFSSPVLTAALGALLVLSGALELTGVGPRVVPRGPGVLAAGILSGLFGGLVGNQGGIRSAALLRLDLGRDSLVATATASALLVDAARLPIYALSSGRAIVDAWPVVALLTAGVVIGTLAGVPVLRRLPEVTFRRVLAVLLIALGIVLVVGSGTVSQLRGAAG